MSALILELKQGESMILNGAVIRFKTRTRIELNTQARFLFGKQIMQQDDAVTLPQQIYYALQQAYIGDEPGRPACLSHARNLIEFARRSSTPYTDALLGSMLAAAAKGAGFDVLKLARQLIRAQI